MKRNNIKQKIIVKYLFFVKKILMYKCIVMTFKLGFEFDHKIELFSKYWIKISKYVKFGTKAKQIKIQKYSEIVFKKDKMR